MIRIATKRVALAVLGLVILGCGGGGGFGGPGLSLSADKSTVAYGQPVTIRWNSRQIASIRSSRGNFPVSSDNLNGSLIDTPAFDTTYYIEAIDEMGDTRNSTLTVRVTPSTKKIMVLADVSQAGTPQVVEYLQRLTTAPVTTSLTLPTTITADLLVIGASANIGLAQRAPIKAFLDGGGRVVLVSRAAPKLSTGNPDSSSLGSIGSWFAGATSFGGSISQESCVSTSPGIPFSVILMGDDLYSNGSAGPISGTAIRLATPGDGNRYCGFAYKPPSGGKVGYAGGAPIGTDPGETAMRGMFLSICRWAMENN